MTTATVTKRKTATKSKVAEPKKFKVILLNDNVTTMEFVIAVLMQIFQYSSEDAYKIMMTIHNSDSAVVGVYSFEIAEAKSIDATSFARANNFPLQVKLEEE